MSGHDALHLQHLGGRRMHEEWPAGSLLDSVRRTSTGGRKRVGRARAPKANSCPSGGAARPRNPLVATTQQAAQKC